jgi:hypothetical protein
MYQVTMYVEGYPSFVQFAETPEEAGADVERLFSQIGLSGYVYRVSMFPEDVGPEGNSEIL